MEFSSILVARQRTSHVLYLLSISLFQNIGNTLFDTIGEIKGRLYYCLRFEMIFNSWLLSQKRHQLEGTSLRDGLRLPSNNTLRIKRCQLLYQWSPKVHCIRVLSFSQKCQFSKKILTNSQLFLTDPRNSEWNLTASYFLLAAWLKWFWPVSFTMPYSKLYILTELSANDAKFKSVDR